MNILRKQNGNFNVTPTVACAMASCNCMGLQQLPGVRFPLVTLLVGEKLYSVMQLCMYVIYTPGRGKIVPRNLM